MKPTQYTIVILAADHQATPQTFDSLEELSDYMTVTGINPRDALVFIGAPIRLKSQLTVDSGVEPVKRKGRPRGSKNRVEAAPVPVREPNGKQPVVAS